MEVTEKSCKRCGETKPIEEFYRAPGCKDGYRGECKACTIAKQREHKQKPEVAARTRDYMLAYMADPGNRDRVNGRLRGRYATNDGGFKDKSEEYRSRAESKDRQRGYQQVRNADPTYQEKERQRKQSPAYLEYRRDYHRRRIESDEDFRLGFTLRSLVKVVLQATGKKKSIRTVDILGYSTTKLRDRIACQFLPGMSWSNHGEWHIDHKKPVAEFIRQGVTDPSVINMLCNLQPLWAAENIVKRDSWSPPAPVNDNQSSEAA